MKRLIWLATRLYPSAWRERYGLEFEALLEDANSGGGDLWDVLLSPVRFVSTTVMRAFIGNTPPEPEAPMRLLMGAEQQVLSRGSLSNLIQRVGLYPAERARLPLEDINEPPPNSRRRYAWNWEEAGSFLRWMQPRSPSGKAVWTRNG